MLPCARTSMGDAAPIPTERWMPAPASIREKAVGSAGLARYLAFPACLSPAAAAAGS